MEEIKTWALSHMSDLLRSLNDPQMITEMANYILTIQEPDQVRAELSSMLGVEDDDTSQSSLLLRARKLDFIDSFIEKRFAIQKKIKKKKPVKIEMNKPNMERLQKELNGPAFVSKRLCYCMATTHELIGNCLACGKIVCAIEGRGPCMYCGHMVVPKGEVPQTLPDEKSYIQAIQHKEKLLAFDQNTDERLAVIDDHTDWFDIANNAWFSPEDREAALKMEKEQKERAESANRTMHVTVDLANATVDADIRSKKVVEKDKVQQKEKAGKFFIEASKRLHASTDLDDKVRVVYEQVMSKLKNEPVKEKPKKEAFSVVQNEDPFAELAAKVEKPKIHDPMIFTEGQDKRQCLTMHQPWASLLVYGFKRVEGRNWSTDYRGPLWIHASARRPTPEDIAAVESFYTNLYGNAPDKPSFPDKYPTGVLLGRVELIDVLSGEEYNEITPENFREDNESKFRFIIKNPMKLLVPIRMLGSKKIYNLDFQLWEGACRGLRRVYTKWWPVLDQEEEENVAELYY
ncbi:unnamed protein product [Blepharisma stoltei]|uniref:Activating signal cointegrator 1 n=1 Tax=Blepharisma stoltei TaxID=1481888 RepID=A0AAU9JKJ9_9CILI|nr:unnamed protein product [Blepharisma stoltei]